MVVRKADFSIFVLSRHNSKKKSYSINKFINECSKYANQVIYYIPDKDKYILEINNNIEEFLFNSPDFFKYISKKIISNFKNRRLVRRTLQAIYLIFNPHSLFLIMQTVFLKDYDALHVVKTMENLNTKRIMIISHSAGCILAAKVQNYEKIFSCICFGYPFRHPGKDEEPFRTAPLAHIKKPFLIVQGKQDEYGSVAEAKNYAISPLVKFISINSDHDYNEIHDDDYLKITEQLLQVLSIKSI